MNSGPTNNVSQPVKIIRPIEDFNAPTIDAWISQLPLSDVDAACEAIYGLLRGLNTTDGLECLERQRIVEQIRPPAVSLIAMCSEKHLPETTLFPLSPANRRHTQRNVDICLELANAYRRIVTSGTFFSDNVMNEANRAQIVYRALQAYGLALLRSLERYESPPEGFWRESYAFYRFAEGHKLHTLNLMDGTTVDGQFKQMLLLALSSHQHHPPDEIRQFYTALMLIAKDADIQDTQQRGEETAPYYFDIGTDNAPRPMKRAKGQAAGDRRYLFTASMLDNARRYFANPIHRATNRFKLRSEVITSLLDALALTEKRRYVRKSASGRLRFVVGLARLIDELSGEASSARPEVFEPILPDPVGMGLVDDADEEEEEIVLGQNPVGGRDDIWVTSRDSAFSHALTSDMQAKMADYLNPADLGSIELMGGLLNSSAGGYCLKWLIPQVAGAKVGELIGLYEHGPDIHLGVVRWLHHKRKFELMLGIQLLSPVVEAVNVEQGVDGESPQRALYLHANGRLGQPASLLCCPGAFREGQNAVIHKKGERLHYFRLEKLLISTPSFQLFSLADAMEAPASEAGGQNLALIEIGKGLAVPED